MLACAPSVAQDDAAQNDITQNDTAQNEATQTNTTPDCDSSNLGMAQMQRATIALVNARGETVDVVALIADDELERASGYQHICPEVIARTAILFRFDAPRATQFHMRNVKAPLDIGFFDRAGVLIQSMLMQPYTDNRGDGEETLYAPMQPFQYALEARDGFFAEHNLLAGATTLRLRTLP
ncbi:MAG: DUF192 domain-containing protein [bacterium]